MEVKITLKKGKESSIQRFHPWIFSGAIASASGEPSEGDVVSVYDDQQHFLARGHVQMGSIAIKILTFENEKIDHRFWSKRIHNAYNMRKALGLVDNDQTTCYRLIHGEGDSLPGLIVDIYGQTAVIQAHSVGMYLSRQAISDSLRQVFGKNLTAVYDKSSATLPSDSDLDAQDGYLFGAQNDEVIKENGNIFAVNWFDGQKTGFFIDQRNNRELVKRYAKGRSVLNTFCYTGGFSVYALAGGAQHVDSVDSSENAVILTQKNVVTNFGADAPHNAYTADVFDFMKDIKDKYDMIILDPPAFAKHHKVLGNALQGYKRLNVKAFQQIKPGGILFTFSCSQAVSPEQFRSAVFAAAALAGRNVRIIHQLAQPEDHPINIFHPEGEYLKGLVLYVD